MQMCHSEHFFILPGLVSYDLLHLVNIWMKEGRRMAWLEIDIEEMLCRILVECNTGNLPLLFGKDKWMNLYKKFISELCEWIIYTSWSLQLLFICGYSDHKGLDRVPTAHSSLRPTAVGMPMLRLWGILECSGVINPQPTLKPTPSSNSAFISSDRRHRPASARTRNSFHNRIYTGIQWWWWAWVRLLHSRPRPVGWRNRQWRTYQCYAWWYWHTIPMTLWFISNMYDILSVSTIFV